MPSVIYITKRIAYDKMKTGINVSEHYTIHVQYEFIFMRKIQFPVSKRRTNKDLT